jgi:hypothetical protein
MGPAAGKAHESGYREGRRKKEERGKAASSDGFEGSRPRPAGRALRANPAISASRRRRPRLA